MPLPLRIRQYLNNRCIIDSVINSKGLEWDPLSKRIVVPVRDKNKKLLFNKYRRDPHSASHHEGPKYTYDVGAKTSLYNIDSISVGDKVIITEGEFDALVLESNGFKAVSSTGGSQSFRQEWSDLIDCNEIYICFDADTAGVRGAIKTHVTLPGSKVIWLPVLQGFKDVTDFFMVVKNPKEEFKNLISIARKINFPDEPAVPPTNKSSLKALISDFNILCNTYLTIQRDLLNEEEPDIYPSAIVQYCTERKDYYTHLLKLKDLPSRPDFNNDRLTTAKQYPIPNIIKVNFDNFARCIWHEDKTPSMKYYEKTNSVYCFGCSKSGDAIDVYAAKNNVSIKVAIDELFKKIHG